MKFDDLGFGDMGLNHCSHVGPTVFRGKFCQILWAWASSLAKLSKFCSSPQPPIYDWKLRELFRNFSLLKVDTH